jgi:hypothetical protein
MQEQAFRGSAGEGGRYECIIACLEIVCKLNIVNLLSKESSQAAAVKDKNENLPDMLLVCRYARGLLGTETKSPSIN